MLELTHGNLLTAPVQALVNTVNTEGVMGKGIALQFKQAFPSMFKAYEAACKAREVQLGQMHVYDLGGLVGGPRWIINFPTKGHWKSKSSLADVESGLQDLISKVRELNIESIAVPPLGCGYGGLKWSDVEPLIQTAFAQVPTVEVKLYPPDGTPQTATMPNHTERPGITPGRAALIAMMQRYSQGLLDPFISLLEIHKLMYFLQEAGQSLRLQYEAKEFGPYAKNLRHVLIQLDGHYIQGYGAGEDNPSKTIELKEGAADAAAVLLDGDAALCKRIDRVATLIQGFEDPYGLELLSSVHWVMRANLDACDNADVAVEAVQNWNARKRATLKPEHLRSAWHQLKAQHWDVECRTAVL